MEGCEGKALKTPQDVAHASQMWAWALVARMLSLAAQLREAGEDERAETLARMAHAAITESGFMDGPLAALFRAAGIEDATPPGDPALVSSAAVGALCRELTITCVQGVQAGQGDAAAERLSMRFGMTEVPVGPVRPRAVH